jgi:hypothetical protein
LGADLLCFYENGRIRPVYLTKAYLSYMDSLNTSGQRIRALNDETLAVKI